MPKITLCTPSDATPVEITLDWDGKTLTVSGDGQTLSAHICLDAQTSSSLSGRWTQHTVQQPFHVARDKNTLWVWLNGQSYTFQLPESGRRSARRKDATGSHSGEITAPMPGKILAVKAAPGDTVSKDQPVIIMESMKMEMSLSAPMDGRLESLACTPGDRVEMGAVLAKIEKEL